MYIISLACSERWSFSALTSSLKQGKHEHASVALCLMPALNPFGIKILRVTNASIWVRLYCLWSSGSISVNHGTPLQQIWFFSCMDLISVLHIRRLNVLILLHYISFLRLCPLKTLTNSLSVYYSSTSCCCKCIHPTWTIQASISKVIWPVSLANVSTIYDNNSPFIELIDCFLRRELNVVDRLFPNFFLSGASGLAALDGLLKKAQSIIKKICVL